LQGSVATYLRCGGIVNNQIKNGLLMRLPLKKIEIGEYLARLQERRWSPRALCAPGHYTAKKKKVHDTIHLFACNYAKCLSILKISSLTDSATKPCLIWLLTIPPHLKYVTTVPCNLSLITTLVGDCRSFSDVSVSQGNVATHSRYGEIFDK